MTIWLLAQRRNENIYFVTLSESEGSRFFAEFILSKILRSLRSLRMTQSEGLRMTGGVAKRPQYACGHKTR